MIRSDLRVALAEARAGLREHPARATLGGLGPAIAAATILAVVGISASGSAGVGQRLADLTSTEVVTRPTEVGAPIELDWRADAAVRRIEGVEETAVTWVIPRDQLTTLAAAPFESRDAATVDVDLRATSPGYFGVSAAQLGVGSTLTAHDEIVGALVAVVGTPALSRLGVPSEDAVGRLLFIDGMSFTIVGVVDDVGAHPEALTSVMIPTTTARGIWGTPGPESDSSVLTLARPGAGEVVARQVPVAIAPANAEGLNAVPPLEPVALRRSVLGDLSMLAAALLILAITAGAAMTVVSTLSGLRDRRTELALRRAIGATKGDVACQVAIESTTLGLLGGVFGICAGVLTTTAIALARHWQAVMDPLAVLIALTVAVGLGVATGATAAVRAAQVDPAEAIRS